MQRLLGSVKALNDLVELGMGWMDGSLTNARCSSEAVAARKSSGKARDFKAGHFLLIRTRFLKLGGKIETVSWAANLGPDLSSQSRCFSVLP